MRSKQEVQQHTFVETRNAIDTLCRIASALQQGSNMVDLRHGQCTFFLVGVVYQGVSALMTIGQGNPSAEIRESITALRWLLRHIRTRWPLSGEFLDKKSLQARISNVKEGVYESILDAKEALLAAEAI